MQLVQWNPFREMDDMLARFRTGFGRVPGEPAFGEWSPAVDITEAAREYLVKGELPGMKKEDVKIEVVNGILTLSGERKFERVEKDEKHHRIERSYGSFTRSFVLPDDVVGEKISAEFKDGVITVHLPKTEIKKSKTAQIKVQ